jgi:hypothetical protein
MVQDFKTKNPDSGKFLEGLAMEDVCMDFWSILRLFEIFFGRLIHY